MQRKCAKKCQGRSGYFASNVVPAGRPSHGPSLRYPRSVRAGLVALVLVLVAAVVPSASVAGTTARPQSDPVGTPGQLTAIPHFRDLSKPDTVGARARALSSGSSTPSPPFRECPAVGADQSCGVLIYVTSSGVKVLSDPSQGPYDGGDDTLVGVLNASDKALPSLALSSSTDIFGFDGDGICTYSGWTGAAQCPYGQ